MGNFEVSKNFENFQKILKILKILLRNEKFL